MISFRKLAHVWELEVLKFRVLFLPSNFLRYCIFYTVTLDCLSNSEGSRPGNLSRVPGSHSWDWGMLKMPDSSQPTHLATTGSFLFLWKSNILWDEKKCNLRNARTAVSFSHRKLWGWHSEKCCLPNHQCECFLLTQNTVH